MPYLVGAIALSHVAGLASLPHVLTHGRTVPGTIAWALSLLTIPWIAVPLYWVVGRYRYRGYIDARRSGDLEIHHVAEELREHIAAFRAEAAHASDRLALFCELARMPFTRGNRFELLVDGEATFDSLFAGVREARDYVLAQFYILREDGIGASFRDLLVERARAGVRVYVLFDVIGCHDLAPDYLEALREAGIEVRGFGTLRRRINRLQINFRNHRKVVVVDGRKAWVGGMNVGDEYLGKASRFGPWRDTHVVFEGPAVQCVQLSFLEDWFWVEREVPELEWRPRAAEASDQAALALPSGPADDFETCSFLFLHAIHSARRRIWIASAYFVPDEPVVAALQLAGLRGVDVRILLPEKVDHLLVWLSSFSYYDEMQAAGVRIYRYQRGFLHQKVMLVDDDLASVGTANLDNRSFRLNFEISMLVADRGFAGEVEAMLERDFAASHAVDAASLARRPWWFWVAVQLARLASPVQ